jgi:hypothetical protein
MLRWCLLQEEHTIGWSETRRLLLLQTLEFWMGEEFIIAANVFILGLIAATLFVFVAQQAYYVSRNLTQIELAKI